MPTSQSKPFRDLTGEKHGWWYVVAYAGQRDDVHHWRCMCRGDRVERVVAQPDILDRKANVLYRPCHCQEPWGNLAGCIYGHWTVTELVRQDDPEPPAKAKQIWKCRCTCGTERDIAEDDIARWRTLSCGCCAEAEVLAQLRPLWDKVGKGYQAFMAASRGRLRRRNDNEWTGQMDQALRTFQPWCVLCGATDDLTTHHVRPVSRGYGLEPGNAVRLCLVCNSSLHDNDLSELPPEMASHLEMAAARFKEYWDSECRTPRAGAVSPLQTISVGITREEALQTLDPTLVALLCGIEQGDNTAIPTLADWLEERGDLRAREVGNMTELDKDEMQSDKVWERLGLSVSQRNALKEFLGITQTGIANSVEEIAQCADKKPKVQTIRIRIALALHRLAVPAPGSHPR